MRKLYIFDSAGGYPARCIGREDDLGLDPVARTGLAAAVAKEGDDLEAIGCRFLTLDAAPPLGEILVDDAGEAEDLARVALGGNGILSLTVIAGVLVHIVRNRIPDMTPQEQAAIDGVATALPDVQTLRALLLRGGLGRDLSRVRTILETLAGV